MSASGVIGQARQRVRVGAGPAAVYLLALVLVGVNLFAPSEPPLPWWLPMSAGVLFLAAQALPATRFTEPWISPKNAALGLAALQLLLFPTLIQFGLTYRGLLPRIPSDDALARAIGYQMIAFVGLGIGLTFAGRIPVQRATQIDAIPQRRVNLLILAGTAGLLIRYPSVSELVTYFKGERLAWRMAADDLSAIQAASGFLLPALGFGLMVSALNAIDRRGGRFGPYALAATACGLAASALFSYNRASLLVPMVIFAAVYSTHLRRLTRARATILVVLVMFAAVALTQLRTEAARTDIRAAGGDVAQFGGYSLGLDELQLYGAAPQFVAIAEDVVRPRGDSFIVNAIMSPVPRVGEEFRNANGTLAYNAKVYGVGGAVDMTLPALLEFKWDLGLAGIFAGYLLLGAAVGSANRRFIAAGTLGSAFAWAFIGCWLAAGLIMQLETLSQILLYWSLPLLVLLRRVQPDRA